MARPLDRLQRDHHCRRARRGGARHEGRPQDGGYVPVVAAGSAKTVFPLALARPSRSQRITPRRWWAFALMLAAAIGTARAQDVDPEANPVWQKVRADLFGDARIGPGEGVVSLEMPARAQDASIVPVSIRAARSQD